MRNSEEEEERVGVTFPAQFQDDFLAKNGLTKNFLTRNCFTKNFFLLGTSSDPLIQQFLLDKIDFSVVINCFPSPWFLLYLNLGEFILYCPY